MRDAAADYTRVIALTRQPVAEASPKVIARTIDFERPERTRAGLSR